uniref:50S ribosomal protein L6 n=1 Tax=Palpitomonas bilix TaxID=652834 RepID=A0A1E1GHS1_9EUKA|nr:50S ribosomal protein L6 [Palpitomonas bilix]BAV82418.1 50S ribosomal protein L6 [Palpitomonas bilix]
MIFIQNRFSLKIPNHFKIQLENDLKNICVVKNTNTDITKSILIPKNISDNFNLSYNNNIFYFKPLVSRFNKLPKKIREEYGTFFTHFYNELFIIENIFIKELQLHGVGFRVVKEQNNVLIFKLGYSHDISYQIPNNIYVHCPNNSTILLMSKEKDILGLISAKIRAFRPPEPFKGKGVRYSGEKILLKEVKKSKK